VHYLLITLAYTTGGPAGKGPAFATLIRFFGSSYFARMEIFCFKKVVVCVRNTDTAPYVHHRLELSVVHSNSAHAIGQDCVHKKQIAVPTAAMKPMEIDPFSTFFQDEMNECLSLWKCNWSNVLPMWRTTVIARLNFDHADHYCHPTSTSTTKRMIRSKHDLRQFLVYCSSDASKYDGNGSQNIPDFETLLVL
jgi:hypothetical protein